jgi:proteasome lid subunit RPN8/RPN11
VLGNFHSHPASPSRPSEEDKRLAFDAEASYLILSLQEQDQAVLKSFKMQKHVVSEEQITIVEGAA